MHFLRLPLPISAALTRVHLCVLLLGLPGVLSVLCGCQANCPHSTERVGEVCRPRNGGIPSAAAGAVGEDDSAQSGVTTFGPRDGAGQSAQKVSTAANTGGVAGSSKGDGGQSASASQASTKNVGGAGGADGSAAAGGGASAGGEAGDGARAHAGETAKPACTPSAEVCDGADNDCDGRSDEMVQKRCWADQDEDGFAPSDAKVVESCDECGDHSTATEPTSAADSDCDDADKTRSPSATDICGDNLDNNCDGTPDNEATNACGGPCMMQLPGKPGEPCTNGLKGACARKGSFRCKPDHTLACSAEPVTGTQEVCGDQSDNDCDGVMDNGCVKNACGGWTALDRPPGTSCSTGEGSCRSTGRYECRGADDTVCSATTKPKNGCGGCAELAHRPGQTCSADCNGTGHWVCSGADNVICDAVAKPRNACRGCKPLTSTVGADCRGECDATGRTECNGEDATVCKLATDPHNACGGCTTLGLALGTDCTGDCGFPGTVACDGKEKTTCKPKPGFARNECGGCLAITPERRVGQTCTAGTGKCVGTAKYHCVHEGDQRWTFCDAVAIGDGFENACGGCTTLTGEIGAACNDPFTDTPGVLACDGTERLYCQVPSF